MSSFWEGFEKQAVSVGWLARKSEDAIKRRALAAGAPKAMFKGMPTAKDMPPELSNMTRRDLKTKGFDGLKQDLQPLYGALGKNFPKVPAKKKPTLKDFDKSLKSFARDAQAISKRTNAYKPPKPKKLQFGKSKGA